MTHDNLHLIWAWKRFKIYPTNRTVTQALPIQPDCKSAIINFGQRPTCIYDQLARHSWFFMLNYNYNRRKERKETNIIWLALVKVSSNRLSPLHIEAKREIWRKRKCQRIEVALHEKPPFRRRFSPSSPHFSHCRESTSLGKDMHT